MADNSASGQDTRLPGASEISAAPSDCTAPKSGPTSAKAYKRSKKAKSPLEEASPESSFGKSVGSLSSSNSPSTKTNKRTHFTPQQIYKLEQFFLKSQFPTAKDRENLAKELQLSVKHIQVWFQNHRAKYKRKEKKKEATQKSTVKLQPPSNWPSALPFDSSIASIGSGSSGSKGSDGKSSKGESVYKACVSPSAGSYSSPDSDEVSGSVLQSSPEKQTPYPLSPSSPLPTPHAPIKRHSSSLAPESPLSSGLCSPTVTSQLMGNQLSPSSHTSSATTVSQDASQLYTSDIAESPVPLYDILDDPDLVSILREHLPPSKIPPDSNYHLPCGSFQISSYYGQSSSIQSQVGYRPSPSPFHSPNYNLSPSPLTTPHISSPTTPNPTNTPIQQQLHPLSMQEKQRPLLSHVQSRGPMRPPYPHPNPYRPSMSLPLTPLPGYSDLSSPRYSPHSPQPFPQVYTQDPMMYQQSLPLIDSTQFPSNTAHRVSTPQRTHAPAYHHIPIGSSTPSVTSPNLYQSLEPNQKPPAR